jgi:3'(2'), 5'-bisphosphate nucleotidase
MNAEDADLVRELADLAERAGDEILRFYGSEVRVSTKPDATPVTEADRAAEAMILPVLARLMSDVPIVAEEAVSQGDVPAIGRDQDPRRRFWLVDPLDGTKEFLNHNGEFTVNIALIEGSRPRLGVVHLPALAVTYAGAAPGTATIMHRNREPQAIAARVPRPEGIIVLASRSHADAAALDAFLADEHVAARQNAGSSLKFCRIAEGIADLYPRLGRTMEWDTAAGHAVLSAAGGRVETLDGHELGYGKPGFENPHFVARGRKA